MSASEWDRVVPARSESLYTAGSSHPKRSDQASRAISTGQLHPLLGFHLRPIDLVVYQGPLGTSRVLGGLILGGASRLDAFSGYPFRT